MGTILAQIASQELINSPNSYSAQAARRKAEAAERLVVAERLRLAEMAKIEADRALREKINAMTFYEAPAAVSQTTEVQLASSRPKGFSPKDEVLVRNDDLLVTGSLKDGAAKVVTYSEQPVYALASLQSVIQKHALAEGVPLELAHAIVRSESRFNPNVTNAGAQGLMQIKLQAAQSVGYHGTEAGLLDADTNVRFGMRYLGRIYQLAKGDVCRTIAIYRSGNPASASDQAYCAKAFKGDEDTDLPLKDTLDKLGTGLSSRNPG